MKTGGMTLPSQPEAARKGPDPDRGPAIHFGADADTVRLVVDAHRLSYGHMHDPSFATQIARIELMPHQRIAVYERMLANMPLRFWLADETGAAKTVMAGLCIREMLLRGLVRRVLIVTPAARIEHWRRFMRLRFGLAFDHITARDITARDGPEHDANLAIADVDALATTRRFSRLLDAAVVPYDLAVFDRAHQLLGGRRKGRLPHNGRYRAAEALCGTERLPKPPGSGGRGSKLATESVANAAPKLPWSCTHVLILADAKHVVDPFGQYYLWRLMEPGIFTCFEAFRDYPAAEAARHAIQRTRPMLVDHEGQALCPQRILINVQTRATGASSGHDIKLERLAALLRENAYDSEKVVVVAEHRGTVEDIARGLEPLGLAGRVVCAHAEMDAPTRREQWSRFSRPAEENGATCLVATDAAAMTLDLRCCAAMVNYDLPWHADRLERRFGLLHRCDQQSRTVRIFTLLTPGTRTGRVQAALMDRLKQLSAQTGSDRHLDHLGRALAGAGLSRTILRAAAGEEGQAIQFLDERLDASAVAAWDREVSNQDIPRDDVRRHLARLNAQRRQEVYRHLMPGPVMNFVSKAAHRLRVVVAGDLDGAFVLVPGDSDSVGVLWPLLEHYAPPRRTRLTVRRPEDDDEQAVWLHPGEPIFECLRQTVCDRFAAEGLRGAVFVDPLASRGSLLHVALATVVRRADPTIPEFAEPRVLERRIVAVQQNRNGKFTLCTAERLLMLRGQAGVPLSARDFALEAEAHAERAAAWLEEHVRQNMVRPHQDVHREAIARRQVLLRRGYDERSAALAEVRAAWREAASRGDLRTEELPKIKEAQKAWMAKYDATLAALKRWPKLIGAGSIRFLAHALVVPSAYPGDKRRHDKHVEAIAIKIVRGQEQSRGAAVLDVSTPAAALSAGQMEHPGFDLLSCYPDGSQIAIEVKGRSCGGDVALSENEWAQACNLRDRYYLHVVYDCATARPRIVRVRDPYGKFAGWPRRVLISETIVREAAES